MRLLHNSFNPAEMVFFAKNFPSDSTSSSGAGLINRKSFYLKNPIAIWSKQLRNALSLIFCLFTICSFANEHLAYKLVKELPHKKYQARFFRILSFAEEINASEDLLFEICRTLKYFNEIPGFHNRDYLEKQTTLLHQGAAALWASENRNVSYKPIGNKEHLGFLLSEGRKQFGAFKKRTPPHTEVAAWDLSHLFGCTDHIAPSCALSFQGNPGSYQPFVRARVENRLFQTLDHLPHYHERVDTFTFWKANLFALVLGHTDLVTSNIPITKWGNLVFLDNENLFSAHNRVGFTADGTFILPIIDFMVEWPQAHVPLTTQEAKILNTLLAKWKVVDLDTYFDHPFTRLKLSERAVSALKERIAKLSPVKKGQTYAEFFDAFYPGLKRGREVLVPLIEKITQVPHSPYSALLFVACCRGWWEGLTQEEDQKLLEWVEKYHGPRGQ